MRSLVFVALAACGSNAPLRDLDVPEPVVVAKLGGQGTCVGLWRLEQTAVTKTTCSGLGPIEDDVIVDVVDGKYRARHFDGGWFKVTSASALDAPCELVFAEASYKAASDTAFDLAWSVREGGATGKYEDKEAWTACTHEIAAKAVRRDLRAIDLAFDATAASDVFREWWKRFPRCRPIHPKPEAEVEIVITDEGNVRHLRWDGKNHYITCSVHSCDCPEVVNKSGAAQRITVRLST